MPRRPIFPFGLYNSGGVASLVDGSDGDLVVVNGQTVNLTAGNIYSYNSIDIQSGGTLQITGTESITQVGCKGNFICNGTFKGTTTENVALRSLGADNWLGNPYSYSQSQAVGGHGGASSGESIATTVAQQVNGHGAGGNGYHGSNSASPCQIAKGGNGVSAGQNRTIYHDLSLNTCVAYGGGLVSLGGPANGGGHGSPGSWSVFSASLAQAVADANNPALGGNGAGGGGGGGAGSIQLFKGNYSGGQSGAGGGARGAHGRGVFILAESGISGTGSINFSGQNGYNAGDIFAGTAGSPAGGGGGGGAGSGGSIWIKYSGAVSPSVVANGASGGVQSVIGSPGVRGYHNIGGIPSLLPQAGAGSAAGTVSITTI